MTSVPKLRGVSQRVEQFSQRPGLPWVVLPRQPCSGRERATLPLSQPQGLSETQGFMDPGVSVGPEASRSLQNVITSQLAPSRRVTSTAFVSGRVMKTAQSVQSGGPSSFQKCCPHCVECSKFYQREQNRRD